MQIKIKIEKTITTELINVYEKHSMQSLIDLKSTTLVLELILVAFTTKMHFAKIKTVFRKFYACTE